VSVAEIVYGFRRMGREDRIAQFEASLGTAEVLPFDDATGRLAGPINADLERQGRVIGLPDVMIAAIALVNALPVVTGNVTHSSTCAKSGTSWPSTTGGTVKAGPRKPARGSRYLPGPSRAPSYSPELDRHLEANPPR
jgi:predicted nucleic acid-binding protein